VLPPHVRQALLVQCHRGASLHLPPAIEAAINSIDGLHQYGALDAEPAFPMPADDFPDHLARAACR